MREISLTSGLREFLINGTINSLYFNSFYPSEQKSFERTWEHVQTPTMLISVAQLPYHFIVSQFLILSAAIHSRANVRYAIARMLLNNCIPIFSINLGRDLRTMEIISKVH